MSTNETKPTKVFVLCGTLEDGVEILAASTNLIRLTELAHKTLAGWHEEMGYGDDEVEVIVPEHIVDGETIFVALAHQYAGQPGSWFDCLTIEGTDLI